MAWRLILVFAAFLALDIVCAQNAATNGTNVNPRCTMRDVLTCLKPVADLRSNKTEDRCRAELDALDCLQKIGRCNDYEEVDKKLYEYKRDYYQSTDYKCDVGDRCTMVRINTCYQPTYWFENSQEEECQRNEGVFDCLEKLGECQNSTMKDTIWSHKRYQLESTKYCGVNNTSNDTCTMGWFNACTKLIYWTRNGDKQDECRIRGHALQCLYRMGDCGNDTERVPAMMKTYKIWLYNQVKSCGDLGISGCNVESSNLCANPLMTLGQHGSDLSSMCQTWWNAKKCFYDLTDACGSGHGITNYVRQIVQNVAKTMDICDGHSSCTNESLISCMSGMEEGRNNYERCQNAKQAHRCIEALAYGDCEDPERMKLAKTFIDVLKLALKQACYDDGDGNGPSGAVALMFTIPLVGVMSLVALIYN